MGRPRLTLRQRVTWSLVGFGLSVALVIGTLGAIVNEDAESAAWSALFEYQFAHYKEERPTSASDALSKGSMQTFVQARGGPAPDGLAPRFAALEPGVHDDLALGDRDYMVEVRDFGSDRVFVVLDATKTEAEEANDQRLALVALVALAIALFLGSRALAQALVGPVLELAERLDRLDPRVRATKLGLEPRDAEVVAIAAAIDGYLARLDGFVQREQDFLGAVSHELRTPIAVVAGATEVLRALPAMPPGATPPLDRITRGSADMEETLTALLYLAREPLPDEQRHDACRVDELLPTIMRDHEFLLEGREHVVRLKRVEPTLVDAPARMVYITIGNLLRNAVEHTGAGRIELALHDRVFSISDSGPGMTPEEISRAYAAEVRGGPRQGGLGMYIIQRICARFGWTISLASSPEAGTTIALDFGAAAQARRG